jgi:hypothetical protein
VIIAPVGKGETTMKIENDKTVNIPDSEILQEYSKGKWYVYIDYNTYKALRDKLPTGDLVEVVRCKDCKHRPQKDPSGFVDGDGRCPCICDDYFYSWYPDDNWFCADGEMMEEK